jgi:hypothetical protein
MKKIVHKTKRNKARIHSDESGERFTFLDWFSSLFFSKGLIAIIIVAVLYFFGWRYSVSYYVAFGMDPIFFSFTPNDVIFSGWRIYVDIFFLSAFALFLYWFFRKNIYPNISEWQALINTIYTL